LPTNNLIIVVFCALALILSTNTGATTRLELDSIEQMLQQSEAKFSDIVKGAEKHITWYDATGQPTPISLVYVHGFSATHKELSPMTELLAQRLQANVFYTRLRGHGRSDDAMAEASVDAWKPHVTWIQRSQDL